MSTIGVFTAVPRTCLIPLIVCATLIASASEKSAQEHAIDPAELTFAITSSDKIIVYDSTPSIDAKGGGLPSQILLTSEHPADISELKDALRVRRPKSWFRCACMPEIEIELYQKGKAIGRISVFEGLAIGYSSWNGDAFVADRGKLLSWFDARKIEGPHRRVRETEEREKAEATASKRWLDATPQGVRHLWPKLMKDSEWWQFPDRAPAKAAAALSPALEAEFPNRGERILALFGWFGSGEGPWSGFPIYEEVPERLLILYERSDLFSALQGRVLSEAQLEGAARFFAAYRPQQENSVVEPVPEELKQSFLAHVTKTGNQDNIARANRAFLK